MIFKKLSKIKNGIKDTISVRKATVFAKKRKGFSLIEVVIAITLMAILSGIAMASYTKVQQDAKKNMDYTTAANIATAAQLADADGVTVSIESLVSNNYLQSTPKSQQNNGGAFTVTASDGKVIVMLGQEQDYPRKELLKFKLSNIMRNTSIVGGDFINNCIVIKLDDYDTEISVINRKMGKINIIDNFEIEIGIKHLISLEAKKEFIKIITSKLNDYKHLKEIFFSVQNEDVIIREYPEIQRVKKRDLDGYVNFEIVKDMPVNIEHYVIKYKVLNLQKNIMDIQLILFPKYIEKICTEIAKNLNIKRKYLNMNFDIIQKLIDKKKIDLGHENCIIIENKRNYIILNSVKQRKIYTSTVFEKYGNEDYILSFLEKDIHIFYYGKEDSFIKNIKENEFCVDKLNLNLKVNSLNKEDTVDNIINQNLINIGVVV